MSKSALEEKWEAKAEDEGILDKAYVGGKKKGDPKSLDPEKLEESVIDQLPEPTGWRILVLPYKAKQKTKGDILLANETLDRQQAATTLGYVLKVGSLAYTGDRFSTGPWCKKGDWILFARYAGSRIDIDGGEIKILNDDEIIAVVPEPESILHNF